jgi:hypothetical protein
MDPESNRRRTHCPQTRYPDPKHSPLHETGASPLFRIVAVEFADSDMLAQPRKLLRRRSRHPFHDQVGNFRRSPALSVLVPLTDWSKHRPITHLRQRWIFRFRHNTSIYAIRNFASVTENADRSLFRGPALIKNVGLHRLLGCHASVVPALAAAVVGEAPRPRLALTVVIRDAVAQRRR